MVRIPAVLICITFHELAHGYVAHKLGDDTARHQGRLTLNPIAHIDPIGLLCMILVGFGWAKPVPVNPINFNMSNKKLGMAITALAGPVSNLLLGFVSMIVFYLTSMFGSGPLAAGFANFLNVFVWMNLGLAVFNMIPIPPLDGSKVLLPVLPDRVIDFTQKYEMFIRIAFLIAVFSDVLNGVILTGIVFVRNIFDEIILFIFSLFGVM